MKNHFLGIYTTIYHVENLERSKKWYADMLGQAPYFDQPFYVGFSVSGYELGLIPAGQTVQKKTGPVAYWGVAKIETACADLLKKSLPMLEPITDVGGGIKVATFTDPDDNVIGVIENPHFGSAACTE